MKINFKDRLLVGLDGTPLEIGSSACPMCGRAQERRPATLRAVCADALVAGYQNERDLSGEEQVKRYDIAVEITREDVVELSPEDLTLVRRLIAKMFNPLYTGQAWHMLDPKEEEGE